ncbi:AAA family ATPase [Oscillatoria sp. FACHB-1407]|uniref:AAA family ATPase n=1 Tax=Oscillatoria sp. FACHB-1407 TaxID=2692847 RepID=UPI0035CD2D74
MPSDIILIGPIGTGKSTIGRLLATKLNLPQCSMDEKRWDYYKEMGYDEEMAQPQTQPTSLIKNPVIPHLELQLEEMNKMPCLIERQKFHKRCLMRSLNIVKKSIHL